MRFGGYNRVPCPMLGSLPRAQIRFKNQSTLNETELMQDGHLLLVPGCPSSHCPLSAFLAATQAVIPDDWDAECGRVPAPTPVLTLPAVKGLVAATAILAVLLLAVVRSCCCRRCRRRSRRLIVGPLQVAAAFWRRGAPVRGAYSLLDAAPPPKF